jgi:protein-S-isoprenylcysteine O-methyltransferase Ste14
MNADAEPSLPVLLVKLAFFTVLVPGTVMFWAPLALFPRVMRLDAIGFGVGPLVGVASVVLGLLGGACCGWDFATRGRGTPAPIDPPRYLVSQRLYRVTRNPMYVSVLLVIAGEALLFRSWLLARYGGLVWLGFFVMVVAYEEPVLRRKFGASYDSYCQRVPRWLGVRVWR